MSVTGVSGVLRQQPTHGDEHMVPVKEGEVGHMIDLW